ncbi:MAG: hydrolase [Runella slithyformis]|nr:MAG: hydrolase [Runella slithyformis]TAF96125.1 MAG: hydrolase [Runella sp.]TAG20073.1 MAG: hydrolase [Cytophagales bacterium]TAG39207.1 MAG: hydrolase [Cytophagia bacterium]TAG80903.1 MAG: hydrolase [Cytophagales bacterium]
MTALLRTTICCFFVFFSALRVFAQTENEMKYRLHIKKVVGKIILDGLLDETDWQTAEATMPFRQQFPYDTAVAVQQTQTRLTFDNEAIYISHVVYQPRQYAVQSLRRDFPHGGGTDLILVNFDTFKDKQNAFHFAVNPYGVVREGLVTRGDQVSNDWDNKWESRVRNYDDRWVVEARIPFKTLRYKVSAGTNEWNINFFRNNLSINERSCWAQVPRGFTGNSIAFSGTLIWDTPPPAPGVNISLIPYLTAGGSADYEKNRPWSMTRGIGGDAKVAITPAMNLDLTFNPDFAQVDVDQQITNLSRFELFFPERRQFFLENNDLFGSFGTGRMNPFFTRRIGIGRDTVSGESTTVPILAGARMSGKIDNNWRLGLLLMQTDRKENVAVAANYAVLALQRKVFTRSAVSFIFTNKHNFFEANDRRNTDVFNRVAGLEYNAASANGRWNNKFFYHRVFSPAPRSEPYATGMLLNYGSSKLSAELMITRQGANYRPDVGFVQRIGQGLWRTPASAEYAWFPANPRVNRIINSWGLGIDIDFTIRANDNKTLDWDFTPVIGFVRFRNNAMLRISPLRYDYTYLFSNFDPTNTGGKALAAGTDYTYRTTRFMFMDNHAKRFYVDLQGQIGQYFNGNIVSLTPTVVYRYQPYGLFSLITTYNRIRLPEGYNSTNLLLITPRIDLTFSKSLFFTSQLQYNNQINNVNLYTRLQWRFKPVSDLFIVYTDNYFAQESWTAENRYFAPFQSKNRALILKLTYWLNV